MVGTRLILAPEVADRVVVVREPIDAREHFRSSRMVVVDATPWSANLDVIRSGLVARKRKFKSPFQQEPVADEVWRELDILRAEFGELFAMMFPGFVVAERNNSFRPMITGPEPLHFDTYVTPVPIVTAFVNVSAEPRVYAVGPSFAQLFETHVDEMQAIVDAGPINDVSYRLRDRTVAGRGPLGNDAPRNRVELAPGACWFFDAKTLSHEVIYGSGADGASWSVPGCGAETQGEIIRRKMMETA